MPVELPVKTVTTAPFDDAGETTSKVPLFARTTTTPVSAPAVVGDKNTAPTTTAEDDLRTAGQRTINVIWEYMQALIALVVVITVLGVAARLSLLIAAAASTDKQMSVGQEAFMLMGNILSLVIGFYFGRTNHEKIGGVQLGDRGR